MIIKNLNPNRWFRNDHLRFANCLKLPQACNETLHSSCLVVCKNLSCSMRAFLHIYKTFAVVINSRLRFHSRENDVKNSSNRKTRNTCCRTRSFCQWGEMVSLSCIALLPRDIDGMTPDGSEVHLFPSQPFPNGHLAS